MSESKAGRAAEEQPLEVEVKGGRLVISIGINTLRYCAEMNAAIFNVARGKNTFPLRITDDVQFAKDVAGALLHEEEDGSTPISDTLDRAFERATGDGSIACADEGYAIGEEPRP